MSRARLYLLRWRGLVIGPYAVPTIQQKLDRNEFGLAHEIQTESGWTTLERFFAGETHSALGPQTGTMAPQSAVWSSTVPAIVRPRKSRKRLIYVALAALAGFSGIHNFYTAAWGRGAGQLALSAAGWFTGFGIIVPWLWAAGEILLVSRDGAGRRLI